MKWFIIVGLLAGLMTALSIALASDGGAGPKNPFVGAWQAVDLDGSHMRLSIGGGGRGSGIYHLALFDDATACPSGGPATAIGFGSVDGDVLAAELLMRCLIDHSTSRVPVTFRYHPSTDTLSGVQVTWYGHRAGVPGITDTQIILGTHFALTGAYGAVYAPIIKGLESYFKFVNEEEGGICGRELVLKVEDDSYDPAKAAEVTRKLVEQDKVFAIVAGLGTAPHSAVWEYLNEKGIPDLWIMSGAHKWAAEPEKYPWSVAIAPDYYMEGTFFGKYISEYVPGKKVAILYQNDDFGWDEVAGLKNGLDPTKNELVSEQSYETTAVDIRSQVTNLKNAGAEVVLLASLPGYTAQALKQADRLGWYPQFFVSYVNVDPVVFQYASPQLMEGVISLYTYKMPEWTADPAVAEHHRIMKEYGGPMPSNFSIVGHAAGAITVEALSRTCDNLTREGLIEAIHSFKDYQGGLTLPGITITLSETDHLAIEHMRMLRAVLVEGKGKWEYFGDIVSFR